MSRLLAAEDMGIPVNGAFVNGAMGEWVNAINDAMLKCLHSSSEGIHSLIAFTHSLIAPLTRTV